MFFLAGCATTSDYATSTALPSPQGAYHKVLKGETLWRIAQNYNVSLDDLRRVNRIPDAAAVEVGQLVLIPGAATEKPMTPATPDFHATEFAWPVQGRTVEYFGVRKGAATNKGIGIAAQNGAKVTASRQGKVVFADYLSGYAYTVIIDHGDGFCSVYSRNLKLLVKNGDHVSKGDLIAEVGTKGILHFEIRRNTVAENPLYYLPKT